jgi:hypothetical protein
MSVAIPVPARRTRRTSVHVAAWAVPAMVVGQFAMLAVIPLAYVLVRTFRDARLRALRWWAAGLGVAYATPLVLWAIGPDRAPSLSKDMHPALAAVIVAAGVAYAIGLIVVRNRQRGS